MQENLARGLQVVSRAVSSRSTLPVLANVLLRTEDAGRYQTQLRGIEADEFPVIPSPGERPTTRVSQKELRAALSEVVFAAATDEARPILTGVLTRLSGDQLT